MDDVAAFTLSNISVAGVLLVIDFIIRVVALIVVPRNRRPQTAMAWLLARSHGPEKTLATEAGLWDEVSLAKTGPPAVIRIDMIAMTTSISTSVNPRCPSPPRDGFDWLDLDVDWTIASGLVSGSRLLSGAVCFWEIRFERDGRSCGLGHQVAA